MAAVQFIFIRFISMGSSSFYSILVGDLLLLLLFLHFKKYLLFLLHSSLPDDLLLIFNLIVLMSLDRLLFILSS